MTGIVPNPKRRTGALVVLVAAAAGLAIATFNYFWSGNGIHGTGGALLVVISSALMMGAAAALAFADGLGRGLRGTLLVLIALDIIGTGVAAYFLEVDLLIAAMAGALIGCIMHLLSGSVARVPRAAQRGVP
jgi:hypothetical protein